MTELLLPATSMKAAEEMPTRDRLEFLTEEQKLRLWCWGMFVRKER